MVQRDGTRRDDLDVVDSFLTQLHNRPLSEVLLYLRHCRLQRLQLLALLPGGSFDFFLCHCFESFWGKEQGARSKSFALYPSSLPNNYYYLIFSSNDFFNPLNKRDKLTILVSLVSNSSSEM